MKPINECKTVAELLEDPKRWCRLSQSRRADGERVDATDADAETFSLTGALLKIYPDPMQRELAIEKVGVAVGTDYPILWSRLPSATHAEVLAAVRKAGI